MKKIVIACDSFKECMNSIKVCQTIEKGLLKAHSNLDTNVIPVSDGGDGLIEVVQYFFGGEIIQNEVCGPLHERILSSYLWIEKEKTAIIESSKVFGLDLVKKVDRNPINTTTYGLGEMFREVLNKGCKKIYIGLGGTSTNDAGMGFLRALGTVFYDKNHHILENVIDLKDLDYIDFSKTKQLLKETNVYVLSDVTNPLLGEYGATYAFSGQKGASLEMKKLLEECLSSWSDVVWKQEKKNINEVCGAGAAGGLGSAFILLGSHFEKGIDKILEMIQFEEQIKSADLIITGEGKVDFQTKKGKVISGITKRAKLYNVPVIALAGSVDLSIEEIMDLGLCSVFSIVDRPKTLDASLRDGESQLENVAFNIARILNSFK